MQEQWLPIKGYEEFYQISNFGRVKALAKTVSVGLGRFQFHPEKILSASVASNGYLMVGLQIARKKRTTTIHKLVAIHFIPNPKNLKIINHKDGKKTNNNYENLEWSTYGANLKHAYDNGLRVAAWTGKKGKNNHRTKAVIQMDLNGKDIKEWESSIAVGNSLNIRPQSIRDVCARSGNTYKGFKWRYK